jgi:hypothetical protein
MGANFPRIKVWVSTEDVVYSDLNAEFDNVLNNLTAANVDDYSANVSQMQSTADPGEVGSESLATSVAGELQRLRHLIGEITGEDEWYESPVSSLLGLANAIGTGLTDNRIVSGRVRSAGTNDMPIFLVPNGAAKTVTVKGSATNFIYFVNGTEYTISTDVSLTGLTAAPSSNNTCLVNESGAVDDEYTKYLGEDGSVITVDTMGTEISALVGSFAAFKLDGASTEYFIAYVKSTTELSKAYRGFFFDSSDAPGARSGYTDNDVITLMKLTWVFAKTDGTLTACYNNPVFSKDEPSSPAVGDFWFDIANNKWKIYGVGSFSDANAQLIGVCFQNTSATIGARSFEFFTAVDSVNTYELAYQSATQVKSRFPNSLANVWGTTVKSGFGLRTWDITLDRDTGISETSSTYYYAYLTNYGDVVLSTVRPYDRREDLRGHYHPAASWRCLGRFFNNSSSDIDASSVDSYFTRYDAKPLQDVTAATHIEVIPRTIRFSGASASEFLPPAAKTKGQEFFFVHNGTSISQVYTLTGFGTEVIGSGTTYGLYTNGETLNVYSDGQGYIIRQHYARTALVSAGTITIGAVTTAPTKGTTAVDKISWSREGAFANIKYEYRQTALGTNGSGVYLFSLPASLTMDTSIFSASTTTTNFEALVGVGAVAVAGTFGGTGPICMYNSTQFFLVPYRNDNNTFTAIGSASVGLGAFATVQFSGQFRIPISGWQQ